MILSILIRILVNISATRAITKKIIPAIIEKAAANAEILGNHFPTIILHTIKSKKNRKPIDVKMTAGIPKVNIGL